MVTSSVHAGNTEQSAWEIPEGFRGEVLPQQMLET